MALIACVPAASRLVEKTAALPDTGTLPASTVPPSMKVTVPVAGAPETAPMLAVNVTVCPVVLLGCEDARPTEGVTFATVTVVADELEPSWLPSPR